MNRVRLRQIVDSFRVPDRGSVNPSPLGDGSWFVLALEDCQRGFFVVARQAVEPNLPYLGEGPCLQSAAWPINPASSRNRSHRLLGGGAFTRDRQAEIGFRQGSSSAEISNPSTFMISLRSL